MNPRVGRPLMPPGYGVESATEYVSWEAVELKLVEASNYWLSTTRPDGRPHVAPRWGVWLDSMFWYDGSPETVHARNLGDRGPCVLHLEDGSAATIVEGESSVSSPIGDEMGGRLSNEFKRKYESAGYAPEPDAWSDEIAGGLRVLSPVKVLAWTQFPVDMTRFTFDAADS